MSPEIGLLLFGLLFAFFVGILIFMSFPEAMVYYARSGKDAGQSFFFKANAAILYNTIATPFSKSRRSAYNDFVKLLCATVALEAEDHDAFLGYLEETAHVEREKNFWLALYHMAACHDPKAAEPYLLPPREPSRYPGPKRDAYLYSKILVPCEKPRDQILQGVYLIETGKTDEGWALLEAAYPDVRFGACKKLLQQYVEKYAQRDEAGAIVIPPRPPKTFEFSETVQAVREALIREYPLTEKIDSRFDCFRLKKRLYVVFWDQPLPNDPLTLSMLFEELRYGTQTTAFSLSKHLLVIGETKDEFKDKDAVLNQWCGNLYDSRFSGVRSDCFVSFYLIDREKQKIYKNVSSQKIDEIVQKTLFE